MKVFLNCTKKKLISLSLLLFSTFFVKAQTADETLEWLRAKQPEIRSFSANSIKYTSIDDGAKLVIDENSIIASDNKSTTNIAWDKVKDVTCNLGDVLIVGNELVDGKNTFLKLRVSLAAFEKYAKALKHYATLKGSKLVKEDLF